MGYSAGINLKAIQDAIDAKAPLASPTFTGTVTIPTAVGASGASTKVYVDTLAVEAATKLIQNQRIMAQVVLQGQ